MVTSGVASFLHVALVAIQPGDVRFVAFLGDQIAAAAADGMKRIVADFAARHVGQVFIQKPGQHPDDAGLGLAAQTQQDEIVPRQHGVNDLRHHGIFVAHNAREQVLAALQLADQILPQLAFDGALAEVPLAKFAAFQGSKGRR